MLLIFSPDQPFPLPKKMLYFTTVATDAISDLISFFIQHAICMYLQADSPTDMHSWIDAIRKLLRTVKSEERKVS